MKILICPDKFKGSLSAHQVCDYIEKGLADYSSEIEIKKLPLADGGEGTLDVLAPLLQLEPVILEVNDPLFRPVMATYYRSKEKAYIEMAMASGLQLLTQEERNAMNTSTYGTGELIVNAIQNGAKEVFLFVGGSATNDAGIGMASAMGYKFYDELRESLGSTGECLGALMDYEFVDPQMITDSVKFHVITDVKNPFFGTKGAAHVYGRQKGCSDEEVEKLDLGLKNFRDIALEKAGIDLQEIAGSGAAGGLGGGAVLFLNADISSGIETILEMVDFDTHLSDATYVITGEGKFDEQTMHGKVIAGVAAKCQEFDKPLGVICGISTVEDSDVSLLGLDKVISLVDNEITSQEAIKNAGPIIESKVTRFLKDNS